MIQVLNVAQQQSDHFYLDREVSLIVIFALFEIELNGTYCGSLF